MKTRIIVDSTSDLLPDIKQRVHVVPLTVHFGAEEYVDGVTIDNKTFYENNPLYKKLSEVPFGASDFFMENKTAPLAKELQVAQIRGAPDWIRTSGLQSRSTINRCFLMFLCS